MVGSPVSSTTIPTQLPWTSLSTMLPNALSRRKIPWKLPDAVLPRTTKFPFGVSPRYSPASSLPEAVLYRRWVPVEENEAAPYSPLFTKALWLTHVFAAPNATSPKTWNPRTRNPFTRTSDTGPPDLDPKMQIPEPPRMHRVVGDLGGSSTVPLDDAPEPRSLMPSFLISRLSWYTPGWTTIVSPGLAALMAAWMESPGKTSMASAGAFGTAALAPTVKAIVAATTAAMRSAKRTERPNCPPLAPVGASTATTLLRCAQFRQSGAPDGRARG